MPIDERDIHQTLEYRTATAIVRLLPTGLFLIFIGLFLLTAENRPTLSEAFGIGLIFVTGAGLTVFSLWRVWHPGKPLFSLSPAGVRYRIPMVRTFVIPWREIRSIDKISITTSHRSLYSGISTPIHFPNVTTVLVSKPFYDSKIFVDSLFLRGPGWNNIFIPSGSLVQVALHHDNVSAEPQALYEAVEARWQAFRDPPGVEPARTSVPSVTAIRSNAAAHAAPTSKVVAVGEKPWALSKWEAAKIIIPTIGIVVVATNLVGLWGTSSQSKAREDGRYWEEANRRRLEETKQREAEDEKRNQMLKDTWRRFDADRLRVP